MRHPTARLRAGLAGLALAVAFSACGGRSPRETSARYAEGRILSGEGRDAAVYENAAGRDGARVLAMDFSGVAGPAGPGAFVRLYHRPPVEQGETGTCWAFATVSFLEAELRRLGLRDVKLSEMYPVYWEYVDKARRFILEKGDSFLGQGSEPASAIERIRRYGIVRAEDYPGRPGATASHDHTRLFEEFRGVLEDHRRRGDWDEARAVTAVRAVLDRHLGRPPAAITVDGRTLSPRDYAARELRLPLDDLVCFVSFMSLPAYGRGEFAVPDNWWRDASYANLPLHEFYITLLRALRRGCSAVLSTDFTEPGYSGERKLAVVPSFDLPEMFIDPAAREMRFASGSTTDDHAVHCVGYNERAADAAWFLIKDSWATAWREEPRGYVYYRDDYVRLKVLMFMVHRDAVAADLLGRFAQAGPGPGKTRP